MKNILLSNLLRACSIVMLAALSACAATSTAPDTDTIIRERAEARWEALLAGDLETAYTYLSPGYRSTTSVVNYGISVATRRVHWTSAEYLQHECEEPRCLVKFRIGFKVMQPVPGMSEFESGNVRDETWIKSDGQWWYLPER